MNTLKLVSKNLFRRKGRFVFTLLGITIGMASFVALLSLGGNMRNEITQQAQSLGSNLIVTPENFCIFNQISLITGEPITELMSFETFEDIAAIDGITAIPHLTQRTAIQNEAVVIVGILPAETRAFRNWEMDEGRYFNSQDEGGIVLGRGRANRFDLNVGDTLTVRGESFPIIGILDMTDSNDDASMFMPLSITQRLYEKEGQISYISVIVDDLTRIEYYMAAIIDVASVTVRTDQQLLNSALSILDSVNITLQLISGVALLAAAFGIINTMMTAITERRREIGILRAIGAPSGAIFKIFILESGLYGLLGGIIGVFAGIGASFLAAPIIQGNDMLMGMEAGVSINVPLVVIAITFSLVISIVSGVYPAWKASKLTPVEAISYE